MSTRGVQRGAESEKGVGPLICGAPSWSIQEKGPGPFLPSPVRRYRTALLAVVAAILAAPVPCLGDDVDTARKLNLADLPDYRAALDARPADDRAQAGDGPKPVQFRDLWNNSQAYLGRRVIIRGRVERIFRQAAVGQFPPLAEVWIMSPAGDPFCVVFAQHQPLSEGLKRDQDQRPAAEFDGRRREDTARSMPEIGQTVQFAGTFLKMISYAAPDAKRLAPLIVGPQPPRSEPDGGQSPGAAARSDHAASVLEAIGGRSSKPRADQDLRWGATGILALALAVGAAGIITWQHMRAPSRRRQSGRQHRDSPRPDDPPLEFIN
jgi:hypothetical protein